MAVLEATLIIPDNLYCVSQRVSEALARVEAQRENLASQLVVGMIGVDTSPEALPKGNKAP